MLASLVGGSGPDVGGYLTSGGTESNLMALWLGRNALLEGDAAPVQVLAARSLHHSIPTACDIANLGVGRWEKCTLPDCETAAALRREGADPAVDVRHRYAPGQAGSGLVLVDLDEQYQMDAADLEGRILASVTAGIAHFVVIATVGSTTTGAIDSVAAIGDIIARVTRGSPGTRFYVHVDAAMAGLVAPFLHASERPSFGFDLLRPDGKPIVDSISLDMHKAGLAPYPSGVFLCRVVHRQWVQIDRPFDPGRADMTVLGSRPGSSAAVAWALIRSMGRRGTTGRGGYEAQARRLVGATRFAETALARIGARAVCRPAINILAVEFPSDRFDARRVHEVAAGYLLTPAFVSRTDAECPRRAYRFCMLPHVRRSTIRSAVADFSSAIH